MLIDLLINKKISPSEILEQLQTDKQKYGFIKWYFYKYRTFTYVSRLIKECIINEIITNLKPYRKIIDELFTNDPENNDVLYLHALCDSGLDKKCTYLIDTIDNIEKKKYLQCFYYLQKKEHDKLIDILYKDINNEYLVSSFLPAIISDISEKKYVECIKLVNCLLKNKHQYSEETKDLLDNIHHTLLQNKDISLVVCCMDREENLTKTLPSWLDIPYIKQIIIVDYSSKIPLSENNIIKSLVSSDKRVTLLRVEDEKVFNLGKAYNLAIDYCDYDTILKIDSDYECIDSSWLDMYFGSSRLENVFIHGDYHFAFELSGFFLVNQSKYLYFREDLNGYGYDEMDLYHRIKTENQNIKEIIWFDIEKSIRHIHHDSKKRTKNYKYNDTKKTEQNNRELCQTHSPKYPIRNKYTVSKNIVKYNHTKIDKIFCINLEERYDRWNNIKKLSDIERFNAIRADEDIVEQFGLTLDPVDISSKLYFKIHTGALGCYLSHYLLWNKIVREDIPYALIIEDDIDTDSLKLLLNSNLIIEDLEFIQLCKRIRYENRFLFDGGESYIVSTEGARKLIEYTRNPSLLSIIQPERFKNIESLHYKKIIDDTPNWNTSNSIKCAVDKFMGYCCEAVLPEHIRLKNFVYPIISINPITSRLSNINDRNRNAWQFSEKEILKYVL